MRTTVAFVLYLWIDTDEPNQLRGTLYSVADDANYPFTDEQTLLNLLRQMTSCAKPPSPTDEYGEVENE